MKSTVKNREDIYFIVDSFYRKVRKHEVLGPIFGVVKNWDEHLQKLTDFWDGNVFGTKNFRGNPMLKHQIVDAQNNYGITQEHFGFWLQMWFETIDTHFEGDKAQRMKNLARNMATMLFMNIYQSRKTTQ